MLYLRLFTFLVVPIGIVFSNASWGQEKDTRKVRDSKIIPADGMGFEKLCVIAFTEVVMKESKKTTVLNRVACTPTDEGKCRSIPDCDADSKKNNITASHGSFDPRITEPKKSAEIDGKTFTLVGSRPGAVYTPKGDGFCASSVQSGAQFKVLVCDKERVDEKLLVCPEIDRCAKDKRNDVALLRGRNDGREFVDFRRHRGNSADQLVRLPEPKGILPKQRAGEAHIF